MYGGWQIGNLNAHDYVKKARAFAMVMKRTDPVHRAGRLRAERRGATGTRSVIDGLADRRRLPQHPPLHGPGRSLRQRVPVAPGRARDPDLLGADRARAPQRSASRIPIHIAFDEWNVWYRTRSHEDRVGGIEERYNLSDALAVADLPERLHPALPDGAHRQLRPARQRHRPDLHEPAGPVPPDHLSPAAALRRAHAATSRSTSTWSGETYDLPTDREDESKGRVHHVADLGPFTLLDATATTDTAGGTLTLAVVNRDRDQSHKATIDLGGAEVAGSLQVSEVNGPDVGATNSFEQPNAGRRARAPGGRQGGPARATSSPRTR